jgi:hypothetical protein
MRPFYQILCAENDDTVTSLLFSPLSPNFNHYESDFQLENIQGFGHVSHSRQALAAPFITKGGSQLQMQNARKKIAIHDCLSRLFYTSHFTLL